MTELCNVSYSSMHLKECFILVYSAPSFPLCRDVLFRHFESSEEGTRNVVAECVGKLALVHPETLLPKLQENLVASSAFVRSTVVTALKYTISDQPQPIDGLLHNCIGEFLVTIGDPDLVCQKKKCTSVNLSSCFLECAKSCFGCFQFSCS